MVAAIRVPKTKRARRELLKHAPKLVSFLLCPSSHHRSPCGSRRTVEWGPFLGEDCRMSDRAGLPSN
jgi:hypothetical protein